MILEIQTGAQANSTPAPAIEFVTMQLMPLADGSISVSLKSTVFDEKELDLIDEELVDERVGSLDQVFALLRSHVRIATGALGNSSDVSDAEN
jgi:hypothetical protein